jgi:hypothetical protein
MILTAAGPAVQPNTFSWSFINSVVSRTGNLSFGLVELVGA